MSHTYLVLRLAIGFLDISSDILVSLQLLLEDELFWSMMVAGWVLFAFLMSIFAVVLERCRTRMPMTACQYILMYFKVHAESGEAFFESGPQLITQLVIVWSGIHQHDIKTYLGAPSLNWASAWLKVFSLAMSFISLNVTAVWYNNEPEKGVRVFWSTLSSCFTSLYRIFIISIILTIDPVISAINLLCFYLSNTILFCCLGDGCYSLSSAYFSIFIPVGYNQTCKLQDDSDDKSLETNKVNLLRRITTVFSYQSIVSLIIVIPYVFFLELCLHNDLEGSESSPILLNRYFTYSTVIVLFMSTVLSYGLYYIQARKARGIKIVSRESEGNFVDEGPMGKVNYSYSRTDRERSTSLLDPSSQDMIMVSPSLSRPCSMLYPYLSSAPAHSELGDADSVTRQSFPGGRKCDDKDCVTCKWLKEGPNFSNSVTKRKYKFMTPATCTDECLIYVVTCESCRKQFVGKSEHSLREKNIEHQEDIEKQGSLLGRHFGSVCGYENWSLQIIDKCPGKELVRREQFWQEELTTLFPLGLNETVK